MSTAVHQRAPAPKGHFPGEEHHDHHDDHHGGGHGHGGHGHGGHHDDHHGGHGHGGGHHPPQDVASLPSMASRAYINQFTAFEPEEPIKTRGFYELFLKFMLQPTTEGWREGRVSERGHALPESSLRSYFTRSLFPLKPELYIDPYTAPNKCPEEFWYNPWKWPLTKRVNPKIPPPVDGKYNDFYHFLTYKHFLRVERDVYVAHLGLLQEMAIRCSLKEGPNAAKNCRHLFNKHFSMSRHEEFTQSLLYMAMTGNVIIRETPYPPDFIEQKRKIYDDWLTRTRMRLPGDAY